MLWFGQHRCVPGGDRIVQRMCQHVRPARHVGGATLFAICCLVMCNSEPVRAFEHPTKHRQHTQADGLQSRTVIFGTCTGSVLKCTGKVNCD